MQASGVSGQARGEGGQTVRVYLFRCGKEQVCFYGEPDAADMAAGPSRGWLGWLSAKWAAGQAALQRAEGRSGKILRKMDAWLRHFERPGEPMLRGLVTAREIELVHGTTMDEQEVRSTWANFLRRERWGHGFWLVANGVLVPPAILLTILPGPNLIGYWFAYRAACHALALGGISRALRERESCKARVDSSLDGVEVESLDVGDWSERCGWSGFRNFRERQPKQVRSGA